MNAVKHLPNGFGSKTCFQEVFLLLNVAVNDIMLFNVMSVLWFTLVKFTKNPP